MVKERADDAASSTEGHVERLPSGSLRVVVFAGRDDVTGKPIYLKETVKRAEDVVAARARLLAKAGAGRRPERNATVERLVDEYLATADIEPTTRHMYAGYARRNIVPTIGKKTVREIRTRTLETLYARLRVCRKLCNGKGRPGHVCEPLAVSTIRQIHAVVSGAFAAAVRWEWVDESPAENAKLPRAHAVEPDPPSPTDVAAIVTKAWELDPPLALFLWLAVTAGARRGELCELRWNNLDLTAGTMRVAQNYAVRGGNKLHKATKTHQKRTLALDEVTCQLLQEEHDRIAGALAKVDVTLADDAFVFSHDPAHSKPWNPDSATHRVAEVAKAAGVKATIKSLRHYNATQLLAAGVDLRTTAGRLGHGSGGATTLRVYAHRTTEADRRAAAILTAALPPRPSAPA
ncbi:tyrosine-type recombinase/integrase [Pseudofrankia inefficax]|uniref:Integrase family protein n=1 Tax=Pseudofrankia inefficax (strain DSM 45817 / CECT 9037 / DDB 130130 / EuI1c) TaxID=298654 RepID=E3IX21_PSEI1|nr:site-specific integrase [Pseudofrankia inefficax]ADP83793.1 integrase family protein [Pseudofrankia inefficax]